MSTMDESGFRFLHKERLAQFGSFLKVDSYQVTSPRGTAFELVNVERGDSVSALIHIQGEAGQAGKVRLVEQFRLPVAIRQGTADGFVELPAVAMRIDETPEQAVGRLCDLEGDVGVLGSERIFHFFPSPGACSEAVRLFYVRAAPREGGNTAVAGLVPVRHFDLPVHDFLAQVNSGVLKDAKCIIAAGWLQGRERA